MNNDELFIRANLENKKGLLQDEHIKVLKILYNDACSRRIINNGQLNKNLCQSVGFTEIANELKDISDMVLNICITDLGSMGLILNTMRNQYKESQFALTQLGLEYLKTEK